MSDEKPVPETLDTLASKIVALGKLIDARFVQVDKRFVQVDKRFVQVDKRFEEMQAQLRVEIEAVNANVIRVYDVVIAQREKNDANDEAHEEFEQRLEDHDVRMLALENPPRPPRRTSRSK